MDLAAPTPTSPICRVYSVIWKTSKLNITHGNFPLLVFYLLYFFSSLSPFFFSLFFFLFLSCLLVIFLMPLYSLSIVEQPQLKRDGKVLIVKKGKPFRTPFRLQMRASPPSLGARSNYSPALDYNPQQYVCVAVLRNDKGEEVALKNSEVLFDARGLATFSGLMVMKGTWGKSVQLTFEARWSGARRIVGMSPSLPLLPHLPLPLLPHLPLSLPSPFLSQFFFYSCLSNVPLGGSNWPPLRMLVVSETPALQLMCYTKDKKAPNAV